MQKLAELAHASAGTHHMLFCRVKDGFLPMSRKLDEVITEENGAGGILFCCDFIKEPSLTWQNSMG